VWDTLKSSKVKAALCAKLVQDIKRYQQSVFQGFQLGGLESTDEIGQPGLL